MASERMWNIPDRAPDENLWDWLARLHHRNPIGACWECQMDWPCEVHEAARLGREQEERIARLRRIHEHAQYALRDVGIDPNQRADDGTTPPTVGDHIRALGEAARDNAHLRQRLAAQEKVVEAAEKPQPRVASGRTVLLCRICEAAWSPGDEAWHQPHCALAALKETSDE